MGLHVMYYGLFTHAYHVCFALIYSLIMLPGFSLILPLPCFFVPDSPFLHSVYMLFSKHILYIIYMLYFKHIYMLKIYI